jgi:predicted amidohydrolase
MLDQIVQDIVGRAFESALIRLWLLAESSEGGTQTLSRWRQRFDRPRHERAVSATLAALEKPRILLSVEIQAQPLALIEALDRFLGERIDLPGGPGAMHKLVHQGIGHWLLRRAGRRTIPADVQEPNLEVWFRHFRVVPDRIIVGNAHIEVELVPVPSRYGDDEAFPCSVRVSHFQDGVRPSFVESETGESFRAEGLGDPDLRFESVRRELAVVAAQRHRFWVAPELTVTADLRNRLKAALAERPLRDLVVAVPGSFHETIGGPRVNCAEVIDGDGGCLARHEKLTLFSYPRACDGKACCEDIEARRKIALLVTAIGLVGIAICKDFSDQTASGLVSAAWDRLAPDWLLVPSMGDDATLKLHRDRAKAHAKLRGTRSVVANQEAFAEDAKPGFVCLAEHMVPVEPGGSSHELPAEDGDRA